MQRDPFKRASTALTEMDRYERKLPLLPLTVLAMLGCQVAFAQAPLQDAFKRIDSDGDGELSGREIGQFAPLQTRLAGADTDNDGFVTLAEFRVQMVKMGRAGAPETPSTQSKLAPGDQVRSIMVGEVERRYRLHVPPKSDAAGATAVIIAFHGGGGNPESMVRLCGLNAKSDEAGFIVAYPYGSGRDPERNLTFNAGNVGGYAKEKNIDDVGFTRALLDDLTKVANVDTNRVFATGISNGGMMAYRVASELSDRIAAIAPVAGPMGTATCKPTRPVSVMHFHGTADELAPFNGGQGNGAPGVPAAVRPEFFSVDYSIRNWVKANGCVTEPVVVKLPDKADDGMRVTRKTWGGGREGSEVVLIEIEGGGHTWPGREPLVAFLGKSAKDISANDLMWEFFQKHARKPGGQSEPVPRPSEVPKPGPAPAPGALKNMPDSDATRDAAGTGQLFESIHVPGFTDFREGLNGYAFADLDGNGLLDLVTVTTPPFALDATWSDGQGDVKRTRNPTDKLRLLLNFGSFRLEEQEVTLTGSPARPDDLSQGWRGAQIPVLADFNGDGLYDIFITRQCPMKGGRVTPGMKPAGCSLLLADGALNRFRDVSIEYGALNELAYNRAVSLGDVNLDGFLDIAIGADNVFNAFEGYPKSALFVFQPKAGEFAGGKFEDVGGTDLMPDFGGFFHDSARDKAGPVVSLRDIDNDGDLDLVQGCHVMLAPNASRLTGYSPGEYRHGIFNWRNVLKESGKFQFEKVTNNGFACEARFRFNQEAGRFEPDGEARAPGLPYLFFGDVNDDGLLDVLGFRLSTFATEDVAARFWYNRGGYQFEEATTKSGLSVLNDSYRKWFAFFGAEANSPTLADAARQTTRVVGSVVGPNRLDRPPQYADAVFADFNNDGWVDIVATDRMENDALETRSFLLLNRGDGTFEPKPTTFSGLDATGLSVEAVDLDNDGLLDLIVGCDPDNSGEASDVRRYESIVYHNTGLHGAREHHWLRLRLSGVGDARILGARIEVRQSGTRRLIGMRGIYSNPSYRSSGPQEAHFGLGKVDRVDIEVALPGGKQVRIENLAADRYLDVNLAQGAARPVAGMPPARVSAIVAEDPHSSRKPVPVLAAESAGVDSTQQVLFARPATGLDDVLGEWSMEMRMGAMQGEGEGGRNVRATLRLSVKDGVLTGTMISPTGTKPMNYVSYIDGVLSWSVPVIDPGNPRPQTPQQKINIGPVLRYEAKIGDGHFEGFVRAYFGDAEITGAKSGSKAVAPEVKTLPYNAAYSKGQAFTHLRDETFSIGGQTHTVPVYRCELFARALGLADHETDPAVEFALIPEGAFTMGSSAEEQREVSRGLGPGGTVRTPLALKMQSDESPQRRVTVKPFLLARTEVTQELWRALAHLAGLPRDPSLFRHAGDRAPVENVSWHHVQQWLAGIQSVYEVPLRLPSEAEWEYAARAGTTMAFYNGAPPGPNPRQSAELDEIAWYIGNSFVAYPGGTDISHWGPGGTAPVILGTQQVGSKKPNAFGLYDILGNVMEWVEDIAHANYVGAPEDGRVWNGGDSIVSGTLANGPMTKEGPLVTARDHSYVPGRIRRGGSWRNLVYNNRTAVRSVRGPNFTDSNNGFRVAAPAPGPGSSVRAAGAGMAIPAPALPAVSGSLVKANGDPGADYATRHGGRAGTGSILERNSSNR